jgi:phosphate uptake regulator
MQIKSHPLYVNWYPEVLAMFEKVKIQLDLLEIYFEEKKEIAVEELEKRKEQMDRFIEDIKVKFKEKMSADSRWDVFQEEMSLAYAHLKKAVFH